MTHLLHTRSLGGVARHARGERGGDSTPTLPDVEAWLVGIRHRQTYKALHERLRGKGLGCFKDTDDRTEVKHVGTRCFNAAAPCTLMRVE